MVALHLDISTAKAYLCNQGSTSSLTLSRLVCHILNLADKHVITLITAYIPTNINVKADYLSWARLVQEWHLFLEQVKQHFALGSTGGWSFCILMYILMSTVLHFGKSTSCGSLGVECFQPSLEISGESCISSFCISLPSPVHISGRTCHRSMQTWYSHATLMDVGLLASNSPTDLLEDILHCCPVIKKSFHGFFSGPGDQGLPLLHLTLWMLIDVCFGDRGSLPQSVREW